MISKEEKQKLLELVAYNPELSVNYPTDYGVMFDLPGHSLYIFNEGNVWSYRCESNYLREEEGEYDTLDEVIEYFGL